MAPRTPRSRLLRKSALPITDTDYYNICLGQRKKLFRKCHECGERKIMGFILAESPEDTFVVIDPDGYIFRTSIDPENYAIA